MERITDYTEIYIWNDIGLFSSENIITFCKQIKENSKLNFEIKKMNLSICLFDDNDLKIDFYNEGYVIFIEGNIKKCILFLEEFDSTFDKEKIFYISPTQRLDEDTKFLYPRGANKREVSLFLDKIFNNTDYSKYF